MPGSTAEGGIYSQSAAWWAAELRRSPSLRQQGLIRLASNELLLRWLWSRHQGLSILLDSEFRRTEADHRRQKLYNLIDKNGRGGRRRSRQND